MANTQQYIVEILGKDKTSQAFKQVTGNVDKAKQSVLTLKNAIIALGTGAVVRSIINTTARFQDLRTTLASVTGSARDGAAAFNFVSDFATRTQFGVEELSKTFISLKANGIEPTEERLTLFTDTAAITTDQIGTLEAMTKLFSRTAAGAGVQLEELDMVAERGVPVYTILKDRLGLAREEVTEFGKTAGGTKIIIGALEEGLRELASGATEARLMNLSTAMSNFGINVKNVQDAVGQGGLGTAMTGFINLLNDGNNFIDPNKKIMRELTLSKRFKSL